MRDHDVDDVRHAPPGCTCCCHDGQVPDIGSGCDCEGCSEPQAVPLRESLRLALLEGAGLWFHEVAGRDS